LGWVPGDLIHEECPVSAKSPGGRPQDPGSGAGYQNKNLNIPTQKKLLGFHNDIYIFEQRLEILFMLYFHLEDTKDDIIGYRVLVSCLF
jgi:hypothetical protein